METSKTSLNYDPDNDILMLNGDNNVRKFIRNETILYSDTLIKVNHYGSKQERNILITEKAIYNLKKTELKRRIPYNIIKGISVSKDNDEFVIHCLELDHDYYYISSKKKKILQLIDLAYLENIKTNLSLCPIDIQCLENYVTQKTEKKKDIGASRMPETGHVTVTEYIIGGGFGTQKIKRSLSREIKLSDFNNINLIGKGTHSKVMLVDYINSNSKIEIFAMKIIRKDFIIKYDLSESFKCEIGILKNINNPFILYCHAVFQDLNRIYLLMPFMKGGDLYQYLVKNKLSLSQ